MTTTTLDLSRAIIALASVLRDVANDEDRLLVERLSMHYMHAATDNTVNECMPTGVAAQSAPHPGGPYPDDWHMNVASIGAVAMPNLPSADCVRVYRNRPDAVQLQIRSSTIKMRLGRERGAFVHASLDAAQLDALIAQLQAQRNAL